MRRGRGLVLAAAVAAPAGAEAVDVGLDVQAYPAGIVVTGTLLRDLSERDRAVLHAGHNFTDRRDFGEHADERGGGFGFGAGWLRFLRPGRAGWLFGARADLWFLEIDWRDDDPSRAGSTDVVVLQPTARLGWAWRGAGGRLSIEPTVSIGAEVNVRTAGEDVGEGAILLLGVAAAWRL